MSCDRYLEARVLAAAGEAPADPAWPAHVAACASCAADVAEFRELLEKDRALSGPGLSTAARLRILASLKPRSRRWVPALAAALMIAFLLGPLLLLRLGQDPVAKLPERPPDPVAEPAIPAGATIDRETRVLRERVHRLQISRPPEPSEGAIDRAADDVRRRLDGLTFDLENL